MQKCYKGKKARKLWKYPTEWLYPEFILSRGKDQDWNTSKNEWTSKSYKKALNIYAGDTIPHKKPYSLGLPSQTPSSYCSNYKREKICFCKKSKKLFIRSLDAWINIYLLSKTACCDMQWSILRLCENFERRPLNKHQTDKSNEQREKCPFPSVQLFLTCVRVCDKSTAASTSDWNERLETDLFNWFGWQLPSSLKDFPLFLVRALWEAARWSWWWNFQLSSTCYKINYY